MPSGHPARALALDDAVTLVACAVPSDVYASETLEPKLSDLDWVAAAGAAHHAVIDALAERGHTVLPFRLFTLFSGDDKAVATLRDSREAMARAFDRVRGKEEWVLRIGRPDPARAAHDVAPPAAKSSGTDFLRGKADAKREAASRSARVKEDAIAAFEALAQLAQAAQTREVDTAGNLVLDAAFLISPSQVTAMRDTLTQRAERLLRDGCPVSLTGPWPPYSFASMDTADG
jgi:hypothetical protein